MSWIDEIIPSVSVPEDESGNWKVQHYKDFEFAQGLLVRALKRLETEQ